MRFVVHVQTEGDVNLDDLCNKLVGSITWTDGVGSIDICYDVANLEKSGAE